MKLTASVESWKLRRPFTISRGSRTHVVVVTVALDNQGCLGRGECTPYPRYGETVEGSLAELQAVGGRLEQGSSLEEVLAGMHPGAARNALDCAWWDLRCKQAGQRITELLGRPALQEKISAYTLSLEEPDAMECAARENAHRPLLKVKLGRERVLESVEAVRRGAPRAALIVDANEAWSADQLVYLLEAMAALGVAFVEQPLPADRDALLGRIRRPLPVIADESFHTSGDVAVLAGRYDGVNIKLDKTGGFTEATRALTAARGQQFIVMCGCMLGTSLAMAPAMVIAQQADYTDLDAPLLLAEDRSAGIRFQGTTLLPFAGELWG